ncbi:hypothetical protein C8N46_103308 [Kordia periserrulae]|uniref:Uncharacterized protein n=1 Tax=Kordia periserrulae TaxID=701523 RepID=A0A2T6C1M6_9FLAO|nr:DUF6090 family protein [Kordia periserrulae]PTX62209.1 hypothetical protein C8N46_103308 [Kordia periserrulae]
MARFFRKFRLNSLSKSKIGKYVVYAIGEIVLVVIGILIAVGINNSRERSILEAKEQTYLKGLKEEFETSKRKLIQLMEVNERNYEGAKTILNYTNNPNENLSEKEFSELLSRSFSFDVYFNANNSLLNEMINSGSLKDISNDKLRKLLTNWEAILKDISKQEGELGEQRARVLDMFRTNANSIKTIFQLSTTSPETEFLQKENYVSNLNLLASLEFENNIMMFYLVSYSTSEAHYKPLLKELNSILDLINNEIQ